MIDSARYPNLARFDSFVGDFLRKPETKDMDPFEKEIEICRIHPFYWANTYGRIEAMEMKGREVEIVPFRFNVPQLILADAVAPFLYPNNWSKARIIVLKSRKMGVSTFFAFLDYYFMRFIQRCGTFTIADKGAHTANIFNMIKLFWKEDTLGGKPDTVPMPRNKIGFHLSNESLLEMDSGETKQPGTSQTIRVCHMSENAKWAQAKDAETSLLNSIPRTGWSWVVKESTAHGINKWKEDVEKAQAGKSSWKFIFLEWPDMTDCAIPLAEGEKFESSPAEADLMDTYSLSREQIKFRRAKIADIGLDKFRQEFPLNWREPFLTSSFSYFNIELTEDRVDEVEFFRVMHEQGYDEAIEQFDKIRREIADYPGGAERYATDMSMRCAVPRRMEISIVKDVVTYRPVDEKKENAGQLTMWRDPDRKRKYLITVDPAGRMSAAGETLDVSVIEVFDCYAREQVAELAGRYDEDVLARYAVLLAKLYGRAIIAVEINQTCGGTVLTYIKERFKYRHLYQRQVMTGKQTFRTEEGWATSRGNKQAVCQALRTLFKDDDCTIHSVDALNEMLNFVEDRGKLRAAPGHTDDRVMAISIALQIIQTTPGLRSMKASDAQWAIERAIPRNPIYDKIRKPGMPPFETPGNAAMPPARSGKRFVETTRYGRR